MTQWVHIQLLVNSIRINLNGMHHGKLKLSELPIGTLHEQIKQVYGPCGSF